jgi:hypothetical protein
MSKTFPKFKNINQLSFPLYVDWPVRDKNKMLSDELLN